MTPIQRPLLLLLALALASPTARAAMQVPVQMQNGAQAKIELGCCFEQLPRSGYVPLDITITNMSGATQQWSFDFDSPAWDPSNCTQSSTTLTVENNATRTFPVLVPLGAHIVEQPNLTQIQVSIKGYGVPGDATQLLGAGLPAVPAHYRFVAISNGLGSKVWSEIEQKFHSASDQLSGSLFDPAGLPEDWRGLTGVAAIWLSGSELNQLSPAQRAALRTWVQLGGTLKLCQPADPAADFQPAGFGTVNVLPATLDAETVTEQITDLRSAQRNLFSPPDLNVAGLGPVTPNVPALISFLALFAVIVGPVNIFAWAGPRRRQRLFWTTPLISVAASAGIFGFIVLQDGVGGKGVRSAFVYVSPREHMEAVIQQQTSRTGLLLGSAFQTSDPAYIKESTEFNSQNSQQKSRGLENDGLSYAGDWFISRSLQTQQIEAAEPTRGEITLVNPSDDRVNGAAPVILSSFDTPFYQLVYMDKYGNKWSGKDVRTGVRQTLVRGDAHTGVEIADGVFLPDGMFFAQTNDSSPFIETLSSIRWQNGPVTVFGPVTTASSPP